MNLMRSRPPVGRIAATTLETLAWVGLATAMVAILDSVATPAGLGSIYLIAVLAVAIRRGQGAAEAELQAKQAAAREHEAMMLADAATAVLGGAGDLVAAISESLEAAGG